MGVLTACCFLIGLAPFLVTNLLDGAVRTWAPGPPNPEPLDQLVPVGWITIMGVALLVTLLLTGALLQWRFRQAPAATGDTWGCGYAALTPRMQYTASSFAQMLVALFGWALRPHTHRPKYMPLFPGKTTFHSSVPDPVLDEAVLPTFRFSAWLMAWCRVFQRGSIQTYLLYIFLALIALLLWH
jgi:hydrogenase-4 component B